jgi:eukaryotic-like serine/threonine-protein kinase
VRGLEPNLVAVAPFAVYDADLAMWKEGLVDVIARNLDGAAPVRAVPPDAVLRQWGGAGAATPATAATLARNARAGLAVSGKLRRSGGADSLALSASLVDAADGGTVGREVVVRGAAAQLDRMSDSVSVLLLNEIARVRKLTGVRSLALGIAPLPVLKPFLQGEQFYRRTEWDSAMVYYDRALAADSNFALALRRRGLALGWRRSEDDPEVRTYLLRAGAHNRRLPPRDSLLVAADSVRATLASFDGDPGYRARTLRVMRTLRRAADEYPTDPEVWFSLGDLRYHHGFGPGLVVSDREMLADFRRAIALDSATAFAQAYLHAIELSLSVGEPDSARRYIDRYLRAFAPDTAAGAAAPDAEALRLVRALIDAERARTPLTAEALDTTSADAITKAWLKVRRWPDRGESAVALARALAGGRRSSYSRLTDSVYTRTRLGQQLAFRGHASDAYATLGNREGRLFAELVALGGVPQDSAAAVFARWLAARSPEVRHALPFWAERGDTTSIARFRALARTPAATTTRGMAEYDEAVAGAYTALARRDSAAALRLFTALSDSVCLGCFRDRLTTARLLAARGEDRRALELLRERLYVILSPTEVLYAVERARVARRLGDAATAADAEAFTAGAWSAADPGLQRLAQSARESGATRGN